MNDTIGPAVLFIIAVMIYFIPALVGQNKQNAGAILVLNLLLGWTLIGWVVALIWAMTAEGPAPTPVVAEAQCYHCPRCKQPLAQCAVNCVNCGVAFTQKKCPDCAEMIKADARKCRFCGHLFEA
jgi:hypothetical protein